MKWMTMREFLRGGYRELEDTTVVSNHGRPVFTVYPYEKRKVADPPKEPVNRKSP